ncbi:response regulator transcription factor [Taibaiella koreensis]|uniref:response regulator transcription factor n=1 Tax=Taibaiella koreensis TaxID=1268548 RepID=UPI001968ED6D|nr:response regulator transcription factor [Taibaiella koreensis]
MSIVEDTKVIRDNIAKFISLQPDMKLDDVFDSAVSLLNQPQFNTPAEQVQVLLLDIGLPHLSGLDAIPLILQKMPQMNIVILTVYEEEDVILKALCAGACSYLSKKASLEEIVTAIRVVAQGGSYMSPSIAREIVNHLMGGRISKATILSDRQKEILQKLVDGKSYLAIANELFLSVETIRSHIKKMYKTLQVNNKAEAIAQYMRGHIR